MQEEQPRKLVHHRCGYPLWSQVLERFEWSSSVVVSYRSAQAGALPLVVSCCPGCGKPLKLWWDDPASCPDPVWWQVFGALPEVL